MKTRKSLYLISCLLIAGSITSCGSSETLKAELKINKTCLVGEQIKKDDIKVTRNSKDGKSSNVSNFTIDEFINDKYTFVFNDGNPTNRNREFNVKVGNANTKLTVRAFNGQVTKNEFISAFNYIKNIDLSTNYELHLEDYLDENEPHTYDYVAKDGVLRSLDIKYDKDLKEINKYLRFDQYLPDYKVILTFTNNHFFDFSTDFYIKDHGVDKIKDVIYKFQPDIFNKNTQIYTIKVKQSEKLYKYEFKLNKDLKFESINVFKEKDESNDYSKVLSYTFKYGNASITDKPKDIVVSNAIKDRIEDFRIIYKNEENHTLENNDTVFYGVNLNEYKLAESGSTHKFRLFDQATEKTVIIKNDINVKSAYFDGEKINKVEFDDVDNEGYYKFKESTYPTISKTKLLLFAVSYSDQTGETPCKIGKIEFAGTYKTN